MTDIYCHLFYKILRIRMVEEEIAARYPQGQMRCPTHLSIGQEAVAAMVCENLYPADLAVSTHRAHAHYLAKGGNLKQLIAELYGKVTGCTQGRGGSMNLSDLKAGFVASTAIVANTVPVGVGLAFAQLLKHKDAVTCVFLGDAAVEEGVFYESLNFAVLRKLPVVFVCENNFYSVNTPLGIRQPKGRFISKMAEAIGAKTKRLDGNDVINSFAAVSDAIKDLRDNGGAWLLELETYRYKVHCGPEDDHPSERPKAEFDYWLSRDPVDLLKASLSAIKPGFAEQAKTWRSEIQAEINDAFTFAEQSPFPAAEDRHHYQYADSQEAWLSDKLSQQNIGVEA